MGLDMMEDQDDAVVMTDTSSSSNSPTRGSTKRRANKHLIERRRRARINCSLTQLKTLVLEGMKKDPTRYNRLEKADILEMTVTHLRSVKTQQPTETSESLLSARYKAGFKECAVEIAQFLSGLSGMDNQVKTNILSHVEDCFQRVKDTPEGPTGDNHTQTGSAQSAMLEGYANTITDCSSEPLDLSRTGTLGNKQRQESGEEEVECYTIQKYQGYDVESISSGSQDCDLSMNAYPISPPDHDVGHTYGESVDSGVDDSEASCSEEPQQNMLQCNANSNNDNNNNNDDNNKDMEAARPEQSAVRIYPGKMAEMRLPDGSMWRPW